MRVVLIYFTTDVLDAHACALLTRSARRVTGSGGSAHQPRGSVQPSASDTLLSGSTHTQNPVAPDLIANATDAAVAAAVSAVNLTSTEIEVVAVGMGLRFVELDTSGQVTTRWHHGHQACFGDGLLPTCFKLTLCVQTIARHPM